MIDVDEKKVKEFYENKEIIINDRVYKKLKTTYKQALKFVGYIQKLENDKMQIGSSDWFKMEQELFKFFTFEDMQVSKIPEHFEKYTEDYFPFIGYAIGVLCFPFTKENRIN